MKSKLILAFVIATILILSACDISSTHNNDISLPSAALSNDSQNTNKNESSVVYQTFEEALLTSTDVVKVHYVGHRPFGDSLTEYEFKVLERILGDAADTIYVYVANESVSILGGLSSMSYNQGDIMFNAETNYLLPLQRLRGAMLRTHDDGYTFIHNLIVNLDNPSLSIMYNESLSIHSSELSFDNRNLRENQIISFIENRVVNNPPMRAHIRSDNTDDILLGSQYILVIEINEPRRLMNAQTTRDWMETDIYFCTIVSVLKGNIDVGFDISVVFFANTVQTGEQHIVAVERLYDGSTTFELSSKNSLFRTEQLDEIMITLDLDYYDEMDVDE